MSTEKISVKAEKEILSSYELAESHIEKESKLDHIRRDLSTKILAFLSISGGEFLILLLKLFADG